MILTVDAWLECKHPYIRILNQIDGKEYLFLQGAQITQLLDSGYVTLEELSSNNESCLREIIKQLLLFSAIKNNNKVRPIILQDEKLKV